MSDSSLDVIKEELRRCKRSESLGLLSISVGKIDDYHWKATLVGPKKTGYHGGLFRLLIQIPTNYPENKPEIRFKYPVFHPNVTTNKSTDDMGGYHICIDYINNWKNCYSIEEALISVYQLMIRPAPDHGYSNEATSLLKEVNNNPNNEKFKSKCNEWVRKWATVNNK